MRGPQPDAGQVALQRAGLTVVLLAATGADLSGPAARATREWCREHWPAVQAKLERALEATAVAVERGAVAVERGAVAGGRAAAAAGRVAGDAARWLAHEWAHGRAHDRVVRRHRSVVAMPKAGLLARTAVVLVVAAAVVVASVALTAGIVGQAAASIAGSVQPLPVALPSLPQRSTVFAAGGRPTAVLYGNQNRQAVPLATIAPGLVTAVVDTEDDRFWVHGGIDPHGILRAMSTDIGSGAARQGGSTIAQQLVKNTLLSPRRDVRRKITEMVLADRLEHRYGRRAVLERYLNTVYFGEGAYGVESAAETYFGTSAAHLDTAQAALLAGLIQDPTGDDPIRDPAAARARRQTVLELLVAHHALEAGQAARAEAEPLPATAHQPAQGHDWFTEAVRAELLADPRLGPTVADRQRALLAGGLRIHTSLDPRLQQEANSAVTTGVPGAAIPLGAALVAVDPGTGTVQAVVGGRDFNSSQFDVAMEGRGRQPGSSFKVFTLVAALERGYSPASVVDGSTPCTIPNPGGTPNPWTPANFEGEAFGPISLTTATANSVNCAYARVALAVGLGNVARTAHAMGVTAGLDVVPAMTLGADDVTPLQMASAYATLADDGIYHPPHLVTEVDRSDGTVLFRNAPPGRRVLSSQIAREATQVLQQVVTAGTGRAAALAGRPAAGKTGTTENYQDAWFVGYTPQLTTAVWMGDPAAEVPMLGVGGVNVVGGSYPARIWHAFMTGALAPLPPAGFAPPVGVAASPSVPSSRTQTTTWCWSSCGH